jgi:hypothetical protein
MNINSATVKANEMRKYIQYFPVDFVFVLIYRLFLLVLSLRKCTKKQTQKADTMFR